MERSRAKFSFTFTCKVIHSTSKILNTDIVQSKPTHHIDASPQTNAALKYVAIICLGIDSLWEARLKKCGRSFLDVINFGFESASAML
jgi:hypothetical protein